MQSLLNEPEPDVWPQIAPLLDGDDGPGGKGPERHRAPVFREQKLGEVGSATGRERRPRQKMRVNRAWRNCEIFSKSGNPSCPRR